MRYVVGFIFSPELQAVTLVEKNRPAWQAGLLNGIGGKIEPFEFAVDAVAREVREECGLNIPWDEWKPLMKLDFPHGTELYFFYVVREDWNKFETLTDEKITFIEVSNLEKEPTVPNLKWLIPMAIEHAKGHNDMFTYSVSALNDPTPILQGP